MESQSRNQEIVKEVDQGTTYASVARKYGLSRQTIRTIYLDIKERETRKHNELFQLMNLVNNDKGIVVRTFKLLQSKGIDSIDTLLQHGANICNYNGVGPRTLEMLQDVLIVYCLKHGEMKKQDNKD